MTNSEARKRSHQPGALTVVTGPPCSGKSTYVDDRRGPADVVIDLDRIAHALGNPTEHVDWSTITVHRDLARTLRNQLVPMVLDGDVDAAVWLIDTAPRSWQLRTYRDYGAEIVALDPGREVCHERAKAAGRPLATHGQIERWYDDRGES